MSKLRLNNHEITAQSGSTLFDHADRTGVRIPGSCGRRGSCHECIVEVTQGREALTPRTSHEKFLRGGFRLACQCRVNDEAAEVHAHALRRGTPQIHSYGRQAKYGLDPCVTRGDAGAILLDGRPIAQSTGPILGLAADIGTTTIVLRLLDLETGQLKAAHGFENPQLFGGGDVMGRITYDRDSKRHELRRILIAYINHSIDEFTSLIGVTKDDIYEFVATGNATMRDLFFGLDVQGIGQRPFQSVSEREMREGKRDSTVLLERPARLGLHMNQNGRVYGAPIIACHVGADTSGCLAAIEMDREERIVILMDIGTNTELVLGTKDRTLCASCPAGPAFEGGSLSCGMPGLEGAIESIRMNERVRNERVHYETIGSGPPLGICGSGMVDALGELLRTGRMNVMGRLEADGGRFWIDRENDLYLTEHDISQLAQAKAANIAGILILLEDYGITLDQVDKFYLAGGFANYINVEQAIRIGLIPQMPLEKVEKIGNGSIEGATAMLCSAAMRRRIERFVRGVEHVELERHENFFGVFVEGCQFKSSVEMMASLGIG